MSTEAYPIARFRLGRIVTTHNALEKLSPQDISEAIGRHQSGDWGEVPVMSKAANERALIKKTRIWSVYRSTKGVKFWLITEANRQTTTILLPEDY